MRPLKTYLTFALFGFSAIRAQEFNNDAAFWAGIKLEKKLVKGLTMYAKHQSRFNENMSNYGMVYFDLGGNYKVNKHIKINLGCVYRIRDPFYELRNDRIRYYASADLKWKYKTFEFGYRNQAQVQYVVNSLSAPRIYDRNRFIIGMELTKRIDLELYEELFSPLNNNENAVLFDRARTCASVSYKLNKAMSFEVFYLFQTRLFENGPTRIDFVSGVNYSISF